MKLPSYNTNSKLGEDGLTIVKAIIENEMGWIFRKNHQEHDFGIDAFIDLITTFGQVTGKTIALQIKTGESYFTEKNSFGWVYRDVIDHLNYYLNHDIPVVILLVNQLSKKVYWAVCQPEKTEKAGSQWKMTVPFNQPLDLNAKQKIEKYISPVRDYASQLEHFWEENRILKASERIYFIVDKEDVINKVFDDLIAGLERLQLNDDLIIATEGKVDIGINGYDNDERELYEILEVIEWSQKVFKTVNGLTYFLATDRYSMFLKVIQFSKMPFKIIQDGDFIEEGFRKRKIYFNPKDLLPLLKEIFNDLNIFCQKHNISEEVNKERTAKLIDFLFGEDLSNKIKKSKS